MLLIDAYNVTHALAARGRSARRGEVGDLLSLLAASRYAKREVTLVCDGGPRHRDPIELQQLAGLLAGVQTRRVLYAGDGREADDLVEQLLKESNQPRAILVVSSDRRLQQAAAFLGAGTLGSKEFLEHLYADMRRGEAARSRPTDGLDSLTLEDWERYFG
ncbi:MAG: NYN domain-containing protein, partial [Phycisphaerae bacterium]